MPGGWYRSVVPRETVRGVDPSVPHIARVYDYWLGGKDSFEADREVGDRVIAMTPAVLPGVRANRAFLGQAVRYLTASAGVRQFLDIGTGIPGANNTHEVAQALAPESRVVYVDNDPVVLAHARALLTGITGTTAYVDADARDTGTIVSQAAKTLDFTQPIAVMLIGILHCIPDEDDPAGLVQDLIRAMPPGSHLAIAQPAVDLTSEESGVEAALTRALRTKVTFRTRAQFTRFFGDLELVEPGVVTAPLWRPGSPPPPGAPVIPVWSGVGRKALCRPAINIPGHLKMRHGHGDVSTGA